MNRIKNAFDHGKAFIAFITGGDPDLDTTEELIVSLEEAGADLIEIGVPFSDPIAEGEVIQAANERALKSGCTTDALFQMIEKVRDKVAVPLVLLTYINPIYTYGKERFLKRCNECGIDGIIVPDLPYEEKEELIDDCDTNNVHLISLIAPTSNERIEMIAKDAKGFIYCVSSLGVTGVREDIKTDLSNMVGRVKKVTSTPCAIGFGISIPEQAKEMSKLSDGVIVGSAIVSLIEKYGKDCTKPVKEYVREMKSSITN